jgi:hypothetical protein
MVPVNRDSDPGTFQPKWVFGATGEGEPVRVPQYSDKSFGIWGSWGGGRVTLQGSWDKSNSPHGDSWFTLYESDNTTAISVTANAAGVVLENPIWIRAICSVAVSSVEAVLNCTLSGGAS